VNWLDIWLAVIMVVSIVSGLRAGFAKTGVGFIASVLGLVLGLRYYHPISLALRSHIEKKGIADVAAFLLVFCGVTLVGAVFSGQLARFVRDADLAWLDRLLGGGFGVVRGLLWATVTIWALMAFLPVPPRLMLSQSRLAPCVMDAARRMADASPAEVKQSFRQSYRELNKVLPENVKDRLSKVPPGQI